MTDSTAIRKIRMHFPEISSRTWEHPADRAALAALRRVPGLDLLLQKFIGVTTEKSLRLMTLASAIRVSERQFPKLHRLHREACATLDVASAPELYVSQNPFLNASAIGVEHPFIVLHSSMVDTLSEDEILCVIGHELGHCQSGHALYKTLLEILVQLSHYTLSLPLGGASIMAIVMALREWDRKSELSADRAGLLVVQDPDVSYSLQMKLAGATRPSEVDLNEFFAQAAEYQRGEGVVDSFHKLMNLMFRTHPFPVLRLTELKGWVDSGGYGQVMQGEYTRRGEEATTRIRDDVKEAAGQYQQDFATSEDALAEMLRNAWESTDTARARTKEMFETFFRSSR